MPLPYRRSLIRLGAALPGLIAGGIVHAETTATPKTYVLVHGAWHGGWCWDRVAPTLRGAGHRAITPTHTGLGDRAHLLTRDVGLETFLQDIIATIEMEELTDVILVGHSFGGTIITGVADRIPERISRLVYLDAVIPESGKNTFSTESSALAGERITQSMLSSAGLTFPVPQPGAFGVTNVDDAAWLMRHLRPHPLRTYADTLVYTPPIGHGRPIHYIACVNPGYPPLGAMHAFAKSQPGWRYQEIDSGHNAMVIAPKELAQRLLAIAA